MVLIRNSVTTLTNLHTLQEPNHNHQGFKVQWSRVSFLHGGGVI
jgi:hypothetical protein